MGRTEEFHAGRGEYFHPEVPPKPKWVAPNGVDRDSDQYHDMRRSHYDLEDEWDRHVRRGISAGAYSVEDAESKGYDFATGSERRLTGPYGESSEPSWEPLVGDHYHVTMAASKVAQTGLLARGELGQGRGSGLGGGPSDTISLTHDPEVAHGVESGLRLMNHVMNGRVSLEDLSRMAAEGHEGSAPFEFDHAKHSRPWSGGDDEHLRMGQAVGDFLASREQAGGPPNPSFFMSNYSAHIGVPDSEIETLRVTPLPGAHGAAVSAMGEVRTTSAAPMIVNGRQFSRVQGVGSG